MIEERVSVLSADDHFALVETTRSTTCGQCQARAGCGTAHLDRLAGVRFRRVRVINPIQAASGDEVVIGLQEAALLKGSAAVYLAPLLLMVMGAVVGDALSSRVDIVSSDVMALLFALVGFLFGLVWLKYFTSCIRSDARFQPVILRRITRSTLHHGHAVAADTLENQSE